MCQTKQKIIILGQIILIFSIYFQHNNNVSAIKVCVKIRSNKSINASMEPANKLINLNNFKFIINARKCEHCTNGFLVIFIIHSRIENVINRKVIRNTWAEPRDCMKFYFSLGISEIEEENKKIIEENSVHKDIIQGNFVDSYRNLTYKHVMGLKWTVNRCEIARYLVKVDDDIIVATSILYNRLKINFWCSERLVACEVAYDRPVWRAFSKWSVSKEEYADDKYPNFCQGRFIIYSQDIVQVLLEESYKVPYFWIDDTYVTGILAKRKGILLKELSMVIDKRYTLEDYFYGRNDIDTENMHEIWTFINKSQVPVS